MCRICPKCGSVAEYNAYYGRVTCTKCSWESETISRDESKNKFSFFESQEIKEQKKCEPVKV